VFCGVKVMTFVQLAPAARGLAQLVFILVKEFAFVPVIVVVAVNVTAADVLFLRVIVWLGALVPIAVEAKVSEPGVMVSPELALAPVPVNVTVCAEDDAESK
jgi:hypothetical protein